MPYYLEEISGNGKTHIACVLSIAAYRHLKRVQYIPYAGTSGRIEHRLQRRYTDEIDRVVQEKRPADVGRVGDSSTSSTRIP